MLNWGKFKLPKIPGKTWDHSQIQCPKGEVEFQQKTLAPLPLTQASYKILRSSALKQIYEVIVYTSTVSCPYE